MDDISKCLSSVLYFQASARYSAYNSKMVIDISPIDANTKLCGVAFDDYDSEMIYISDSVADNICATCDVGCYSFLISQKPSHSTLEKIVKDTYGIYSAGEKIYKVNNGAMPAYESINEFVEIMSKVFLYFGIGFAVFASLMLFNFITISISHKKREIGILRAVGARSKDVFNIFFAESFIISMIAYVFAILITFIASAIINNTIKNEYNILFTLLIPGIRQIALVLVVTFIVALVSTFLPVYKLASKKPIDAIRDR